MPEVTYIHYSYKKLADGTVRRYNGTQTRTIKNKQRGIPLDENTQIEFCNRLNNGEKLKDLRAEYKLSYYFAKHIIESHGFITPRKQKNNNNDTPVDEVVTET